MINIDIEKVATENPFVDEIMYYTKYLAYNAVIKDEDRANNEETSESVKDGLLYRLCIENRVTIDMLYSQITEDILVPIIPGASDNPEYGIPLDVATSDGSETEGDILGYDIRYDVDFRQVTDEDGNLVIDDETKMVVTEEYRIEKYVYKYASYYANNPAELPSKIKKYLLPVLRQKFIDEYVECNNYYRMLNGQPDYGEVGIDVRDYYTICGIDATDEKGKVIIANIEGDNYGTSNPVYIHELTKNQLSLAVSYGILDAIKDANTDCSYLWYLQDNKISIYDARLAQNFQLLYLPEIDLIETYERFKSRYEINRDLVIRTVYSTAMKYGSDYYNEFIIVYILLNTMIDVLSVIQEIIARREFIDSRCIKYIFSIYSIPYYEEIPIKYQINLMKSINRLLKFKSTSKNMQDICALFGFKNIAIYRYYILRKHKIIDDSFAEFENEEDNYDLYFIKIPLGESADLYIRDEDEYMEYDQITNADDYWDGENGELKHETIKKEHKIGKEGEDFSYSYRKSKYISIDTINDIGKTSYYISYFNGILFDQFNLDASHSESSSSDSHTHKYMEDDIRIRVTAIDNNEKFAIADLFVLMFDLAFAYYDIESSIQRTVEEVLYVQGFNFEDVLYNFQLVKDDLHKKGYEIESLLGEETDVEPLHLQYVFNSTPSTESTFLLTASELVELFNTNTELYKLVVREMFNADNHEVFEAYEIIYDAFLIAKYNRDFFSTKYIKDDGITLEEHDYDTLTDYLEATNYKLYKCVQEVLSITDESSKIKKINNLIYSICQAIDMALDDDELSENIYANLPGVSAEFVRTYMAKIINFFKSFRVQLYNINSILEIGGDEFGKYTTYLKYHDEFNGLYVYTTKRDHYDMNDTLSYTINLTKTDRHKMMDKIEIEYK